MRWYARSSAASIRPSTMRSRPSMRHPPRADAHVGEPARFARSGDRLRSGAGEREEREVDRVHANAHRLLDREFRERAANEVRHDLGRRRHFAADDLSRDDDRDRRDVLLENRRRQRRGGVELRRQLFHQRQRVADACLARLDARSLSVRETRRVPFGDQPRTLFRRGGRRRARSLPNASRQRCSRRDRPAPTSRRRRPTPPACRAPRRGP